MPKLAIIVGHSKKDKGAVSATLGLQEYDWNSDLANRVVSNAQSGIEAKIFFRDGVGIAGAYAAGDSWGADAFIELHFNASHNTTSSGTGVLYQTSKSKPFALAMFAGLKAVLDLKPWPESTGGVCTPYQASGQQERGKASLTASPKPSILLEPFFGSNPSDCKAAKTNKQRMAQAIIAAAAEFFGV